MMSVSNTCYAELTSASVSSGEAFAYWCEVACATFVPLAVSSLGDDDVERFAGRIEHVAVGSLELSTVTTGSQPVRRTASHIGQVVIPFFTLYARSARNAASGPPCSPPHPAGLIEAAVAYPERVRLTGGARDVRLR
jgi:hypothetical protein